jgi:hypothetical protein
MHMNERKSLWQILCNIWRGRCSKVEITVYFALVMGIYIIGIIISALVYPGGFSFLTVYTSYLGSNDENPIGYLWYNSCMFVTGLLLIPIFFYIYHKLSPRLKVINVIEAFFGVIGCLSFASLGIFHQGSDPLGHKIATDATFLAFIVCGIFLLILYLWKRWHMDSWPKWSKIVIVYGQIIFVGIAIVLLDYYPEVFSNWYLDPRIHDGKLSEWIAVFCALLWLYEVIWLIEESNIRKN